MKDARYVELIKAHERKLYCVAKAYLKNDEDCKDAYSQAVFQGWLKRFSPLDEKRFQAWITKILVRECLNVYRKRKREQKKLELLSNKRRLERAERAPSAFMDALYALPEEKRVPMIMHYANGYSVREISGILGIPSKLVKSRMFEGRRQLKAKMSETEYE